VTPGWVASLLGVPDDPDKIQSPPRPAATAWDATRAELATDVDRVADRLRSLSQARLAAAVPPHASRAAAARATAQTLADASAGLEARLDPAEPPWRTLPELDDFAVGDQVAVTGHDLVAAARHASPDDDVWARQGRRTAAQALSEAAEAVAALRHLL
jgi:hypothetical protein